MNKKIAGLTAAVLLALPAAARADDDSKIQFLLGVDYYLQGDFDDDITKDFNDAVDAIGNGSNEITTDNAIGGRLGIRKRLANEAFDIGVSASYVKGPSTEATLEAFSPAGRLEETVDTTFIRALAEVGGRIWIGENAYVRLGGGAGFGQSKVEDEVTASIVGFPVGSSSGSETATGFTWEISPAVGFKAGRSDIEIGVRYAQFPKIDETDDTREVDWSPLGVYVAAAF